MRLIRINVFNEETNRGMGGVRIALSGGYGETRTDSSGKASLKVPDDVSSIAVYVSGSTAFDGYVSNIPSSGLDVLVSPSGYYKKTL